jgi:hypothetical protein
MDLKEHLKNQMIFSRNAFGPHHNRERLLAHIAKEIEEIKESNGDSSEWIDIVILALDGLTRQIAYVDGYDPEKNAQRACEILKQKQRINENRKWPDWRTTAPSAPIEHLKT